MTTYKVKITWVDKCGNAACVGLDEVVEYDAATENQALIGALSDAIDHSEEIYREGKYHPVSEIVEDSKVTQ